MDMFAEVCFEKLGIAPTSTKEEIKQAFRSKLKKIHPDLAKDDDKAYASAETVKLRGYYEYLVKNYDKIHNSSTGTTDTSSSYDYNAFSHETNKTETTSEKKQTAYSKRPSTGSNFNYSANSAPRSTEDLESSMQNAELYTEKKYKEYYKKSKWYQKIDIYFAFTMLASAIISAVLSILICPAVFIPITDDGFISKISALLYKSAPYISYLCGITGCLFYGKNNVYYISSSKKDYYLSVIFSLGGSFAGGLLIVLLVKILPIVLIALVVLIIHIWRRG